MNNEFSKNIDSRSEKVRNLFGEKPPFFVRWGTSIVVIMFLILLLILLGLQYPYSNGESILQHLLR